MHEAQVKRTVAAVEAQILLKSHLAKNRVFFQRSVRFVVLNRVLKVTQCLLNIELSIWPEKVLRGTWQSDSRSERLVVQDE